MSETVSNSLQRIEPLQDPRWGKFLERHPRASVFHTPAWLEALRRTYGYVPVAYTTSLPGRELEDGVVLCQVDSWVTGRRLVSLPFSDHCEPLVDGADEREAFLRALGKQSLDEGWRYLELRPRTSLERVVAPLHSTESFCFHQLDLRPDCDTLFRGFHKSSTQRKIRRAVREGLTCQTASAGALLESFYSLNLLTRRRQGLPPQPRKWFRNLIDCFGEALEIRVAFRSSVPIAAILTLRYRDSLVFKYGCSNRQFHNLGGTQLLFWKAIQDAKCRGLRQFDLGRSEALNSGLIAFKDHWGATPSTLTYLRSAAPGDNRSNFVPVAADWRLRLAKRIFTHTPNSFLPILGNLLYKHIG